MFCKNNLFALAYAGLLQAFIFKHM